MNDNIKADWDHLWSKGFDYGPIDSWASDIFLAIADLLRDTKHPKILSAGCGRGLIDYWLIKVFGYHVTFLDSSDQCINNLKQSLESLKHGSYLLSHSSIFDIPFPDKSFDLVWNEGVLEHFDTEELDVSLSEMRRVSKRFVVVDVPNANCKPYVLAKRWLEEHDMWGYGYENPRKSMKREFSKHQIKVLTERAIGSKQTILNYLSMVPEDHREEITSLLQKEDYKIFPHLLTIGSVSK